MTVDWFLDKFVLRMEHRQARRDLTELMENISSDTAFELGREEGYRRALEDTHIALRKRRTLELFTAWLDGQLKQRGA